MLSIEKPISKNPPLKKLQFKGWRYPQKKWKQWVDKLSLRNEATWKKSGIFDAVMVSTDRIKRDEALVTGLSEFWCSTINTFVFPWGEATLTLEDMFFLCGYSVLGLPIMETSDSLTGNLLVIKDKMTQKRKWFSCSGTRKASCSLWMNHFMEIGIDDDGDDIEHVGFLILWLSRYVFPAHPYDTVGKHVFSIAIHLAQGTRIAIAPAVLASLYRDLRLLNQHVMDGFECSIWAPFQVVQLWAWKRFLPLRPVATGGTSTSGGGTCRQKLSSNTRLPLVRSVLKSAKNFQWQCYVTNDEENGVLWCSGDPTLSCELVGIDCKEKYVPSRVAKQFRIDEKLTKKKKRTECTSQFVAINDELEEFEIDRDDSDEKLKKKKIMKCSRSSSRSTQFVIVDDDGDDDELGEKGRLKEGIAGSKPEARTVEQEEGCRSGEVHCSNDEKTKKLDEEVRNHKRSLSSGGNDHLTSYKRMELLEHSINAGKKLSICDEDKPPSTVHSQTSGPNLTKMSESQRTSKSSMEDASVDECDVLESRVMQLEKVIAGIKARLKARAISKGKEQM